MDPKPGLQTVYTLANTFGPFLTAQLATEGINFNLPPLPPLGDLTKHLHPSVTTFSRLPTGWRTESHGVIPSGVEVGPAAIAVGAALLLPAVQQAREAARHSQAKNNLKQLGLAMHSYYDTYGKFPANANYDKKDKALLSWRVHILPFIDQAPLYNEFHLDEPWDSEHNKKLIAKIPQIYVQPNHADLAKDGKTVYLAPVGKGLAFEGTEGMKIANFTDGSSNTILLVEAHRDAAVIWTKPDDLTVDFKNPLKNLKSALSGGFHVLMCDGSVRFVSDLINADTLKALFTRGGGEVIGNF
jgi:prepilin-type processing-associated H-X9-DG protein